MTNPITLVGVPLQLKQVLPTLLVTPDNSQTTKQTRDASNLRDQKEEQKCKFSDALMFSQPASRKNSIHRVKEEEKGVIEKIDKYHADSIEGAFVRYEFGRLISGGMIGSTYLARLKSSKGNHRFFCIKRMRGKVMAEKFLFGSIKRELLIL
jgi:hypothetical protein